MKMAKALNSPCSLMVLWPLISLNMLMWHVYCIVLMQHVCSALMWIIRAWGYWRTASSAIWPQDSHCCILLRGWVLWAYPDSAVGQGASGSVPCGSTGQISGATLWYLVVLVTQPASHLSSVKRSRSVTQSDIYPGSSRHLGLRHKVVQDITLICSAWRAKVEMPRVSSMALSL